jgi:hypothetical protein
LDGLRRGDEVGMGGREVFCSMGKRGDTGAMMLSHYRRHGWGRLKERIDDYSFSRKD